MDPRSRSRGKPSHRGGPDHWKGIIAFLAIAFGLAWLPFLVVLVKPGMSGMAPILMPFAPAIGCFVVRKWIILVDHIRAGRQEPREPAPRNPTSWAWRRKHAGRPPRCRAASSLPA